MTYQFSGLSCYLGMVVIHPMSKTQPWNTFRKHPKISANPPVIRKRRKNVKTQKNTNDFTSSDPHRDKWFCHSFWHLIWKYIWAISETLGSLKGHPRIWKGPIAYHTFAQKWCWYIANFGGILSDILSWHPFWHLFWHFLWSGRTDGGRKDEEAEEVTLIKSRNPRLAGGEETPQ